MGRRGGAEPCPVVVVVVVVEVVVGRVGGGCGGYGQGNRYTCGPFK